MVTEHSPRDPETARIIGAAMAVHRHLGPGFLEAVYREALKVEFGFAGVPFRPEVPFCVHYRGRTLATGYRADFLCGSDVIVEVKSRARLTGIDEAQIINYLKVSGCGRGLLLNFGAKSLQFRRFALTQHREEPQPARYGQAQREWGAADYADFADYPPKNFERRVPEAKTVKRE